MQSGLEPSEFLPKRSRSRVGSSSWPLATSLDRSRARYYGAGAGGLMVRAQAFLGVLLIALLWGVSTLGALVALLGGVATGWEKDLVEGRTPMFTSEFLYVGCVVEPDGVVESAVILEGTGGESWTMEVVGEDGGPRTLGPAEPVPSGDAEIVRAGGEDERCSA